MVAVTLALRITLTRDYYIWDQLPETASSATLACWLTRSSLALMFRRAADNFSVNLLTVWLTSPS